MGLEKDRAFIIAAVPDLQEYILSSQLYWPVNLKIPGQPQEAASLTLGNLLLALKRLVIDTNPPPIYDPFLELEKSIYPLRERWLSNWKAKAEKEFEERLRQWERYVINPYKNSGQYWQEYPFEVRRRVILQLLGVEMGEIPPTSVRELDHLDKLLRPLCKPGPYIWETSTEKNFPRDDYWYLYIMVHKNNEKGNA